MQVTHYQTVKPHYELHCKRNAKGSLEWKVAAFHQRKGICIWVQVPSFTSDQFAMQDVKRAHPYIYNIAREEIKLRAE